MKKKKYLPLYYEWAQKGTIQCNGLCNFFGDPSGPEEPNIYDKYKEFELLMPPIHQRTKNSGYWGTNLKNKEDRNSAFCPLRQNIVLLCAALNNEL